jgi:hypothetical protein
MTPAIDSDAAAPTARLYVDPGRRPMDVSFIKPVAIPLLSPLVATGPSGCPQRGAVCWS